MKKLILSVSLALSSLLAYQASAQYNQFWDNNGASAATDGTWDTTSSFWASNTLTASTVPFTNGNFAVFSAGSVTIPTLNINVPGAVTCEGIGNATTSGGVASGARVQTLNISGTGSLVLPTGTWPMECGNYSSSDIIAISVPMTGPGGIAQHNSGTLGLYGNNTYSGGTAATGGQIIDYNNNNSFGTGPISTSGGGTSFLTNNGAPSLLTFTNAWNINAGTTIVNFGNGNIVSSGPWTLGVTPQIKNNGSGTTLTISGPISGAFGVNWETPSGGTLILSGANTFTGPSAIGDGGTATVSLSSINSVANPVQQASSSLGKPSSAANGTIAIGNAGFLGTLIYTGNGETSDRVINLAGTTGGATIEMDGTGPLVLNSAFTATGAGSKTLTLQGSSTGANAINGVIPNNSSANKTALTKAGAGSWSLGGKNTFTGNLTISAGTLVISGSGDLGGASYAGNIADSTLFVYSSSTAQTLSGTISGGGVFNETGPATVTITGTANTFTGSYTVNGGFISFNADGSLGTAPGSVKANAITLNGGLQSGLRANAAGITINANRGITLGANGGEIQVAGNDTCTYNGIISGSGVFQMGQNSSTGLGILALGGSESYTNTTVIATGTLRLLAGASIGNSSGIIMSNSVVLDVSAQSPFALSTTNSFLTVYGGAATSPSILGAASGNVDFGTQAVNLSYVPALTNGDPSHAALVVSQSTLLLNGNTVSVTNASALTMDVGNYALIVSTNGIHVSNPLILNFAGAIAPNTTSNLVVIGNTLVLQIAPGAGYTGTIFTNLPASQSVPYGTATATVSGTVVAAGPVYPTNGEVVTITIPNVITNTTTIDDNTGDFTATVSVNTLPPGTALIVYSYPGNGTLAPASDTSSSFTITKAPVTVTATNQTKTYGQTIPSGTNQTAFVATGLQNGDTIGTVTLAFSGSPAGSTNNAPIGTYTITPSAATNGTFNAANYSLTYVAGTLTVNPLPVALTGTRVYDGTATAVFSILSITNVFGTDNVTNLSGSVALAASAAGPESITDGSGLTLGGTRATNYTTIGATGAVLVNPLPVALMGTRNFDGTATADFSILSITNIVGTDVVNVASGSATLAGSTVGVEPIIDASGLTLGGSQAGNYTITGASGLVTITVNTGSTNIVFSASGGQLTLTWPQDHIGWQLQVQTNALSVGISSNWVGVVGSTTTNQVVIPADVNNDSVFYRLIYPPQ